MQGDQAPGGRTGGIISAPPRMLRECEKPSTGRHQAGTSHGWLQHPCLVVQEPTDRRMVHTMAFSEISLTPQARPVLCSYGLCLLPCELVTRGEFAPSVDEPALPNRVPHIVTRGSEEEVGWTDAQPDIARMADQQPRRYLPSKKLVGDSVSVEETLPGPYSSIASGVPIAGPEPATGLSVYPNISQEAIL